MCVLVDSTKSPISPSVRGKQKNNAIRFNHVKRHHNHLKCTQTGE